MYDTSIMVDFDTSLHHKSSQYINNAQEDIQENIVTELADLSQRLYRQRDILLSQGDEEGVTMMAYTILMRLAEKPMPANGMAEICFADPSTISRQVKQLVEEELITKVADPHDRRVFILVPTEKGYAKVEEMKKIRTEFYTQIIHTWELQEKTQFIELFTRFVESIEVIAGRQKNDNEQRSDF